MSCVDYEKDLHEEDVAADWNTFYNAIGQALDALFHKAAMPSGVESQDYQYFIEDVQRAYNERANGAL
jgi:hypothetical protein